MLEQVRNAVIVDATIFIHRSEGCIEYFDVVRIHIKKVTTANNFRVPLVCASWTGFSAQSMEAFIKKMYKITVELTRVINLCYFLNVKICLDSHCYAG